MTSGVVGARRLLLSLLLLLGSAPTLTWGMTGLVEVRVTDHKAGIGHFKMVWVELADVSLHLRGLPRRQGWVDILRHAPPVDIVPLKDGRWQIVGETAVTTARYDAVRVQFGEIRGILRSGKRATVMPIGSTVVVDLTVAPEITKAVLIDLIVEDWTDHHPGQYAVKIRSIQVQGD